MPLRRRRALAGGAVLSACSLAYGASTAPYEITRPAAPRTLVIAIEVDRDGTRLIGFTSKARAFAVPEDGAPRKPDTQGSQAQFEVALLGPGGARYTQPLAVRGLCLAHAPETPPEVAGDTIRLHRESVLVELPEIAGFDRIEVAQAPQSGIAAGRKPLGTMTLDAAHFTRAGGTTRYQDLAIARGSEPPGAPLTSGAVHFPEEFGDPDIFTVYGNAAETEKRINVVIVPDGYTYDEKTLMQSHAQVLVDAFRSRTPYKEHDLFLNFILVYAYSTQDGTDQCDCSVVRDTAMGTRFAGAAGTCLDPENRCLFYGGVCDTDSTANIAATELRAPAQDRTIVMVNTARYGGCGGERAVYAAANVDGTEVALHEMGHTLASLADEYDGEPRCGTGSGPNVSMDPVNGNWAEWIGDLGPPLEGAQYFNQCIYRPALDCQMRTLHREFCPVCKQQFALSFFAHAKVSPTAPIETVTPASPVDTDAVTPHTFSVTTRLPNGPGVTSDVTWQLEGPGFPVPTTVATGTYDYTRIFTQPGTFTLTSRVVADTNFVKPSKNGANVDTATWTVRVCQALGEPLVSNDGPICAGGSLHLSVTTIAGATYTWTGPGGFQSSEQNPVIANASSSATGTYAVTITVGGCQLTQTTAASVIAEGATCGHGSACIRSETCQAGACVGSVLDCVDGDLCTTDSCNPATGCVNAPRVCTASDACHQAGVCDPATGMCAGAGSVVSCNDSDLYTTDSCNPATGCVNAPQVCTASDACHQAGVCAPATGVCSNPQRDSDHDGHGVPSCGGDDCLDTDSSVWLSPVDVTHLRLAGRSPTTLVWDDQRAAVGPGTTYHVAAGVRNSAGFNYFIAQCLSMVSGSATSTDPRPSPPPGTYYWYLVRAQNSCAIGTWGSPPADFNVLVCGGPTLADPGTKPAP